MKFLINSCATTYTSFGVKRYFENIRPYLEQTNTLEFTVLNNNTRIDKINELFHKGKRNTIFWSPSQRGPLNAKNHVVTVHDCINVNYTHTDKLSNFLLRQLTQKLLKNSSKIIAISESTKNEILKNYSIKSDLIEVIKSSNIPNIAIPTFIQSIDLPPYILIVSNSLLHKNTINACKAIASSNLKHLGIELRVVGSIDPIGHEILNRNKINVHFESSITDERLFSLYKNAAFFYSPSLEEGHNLSIAEALAVGANVLCSDIPAHKEFYDGYVDFFDVSSLDSMITSIDISLDKIQSKWHIQPIWKRSFKDVAHDYIDTFSSIDII